MAPLTQIWKAFVQPARQEYNVWDLGPRLMNLEVDRSIQVFREDMELKNNRGHVLKCSHWRRVSQPGISYDDRELCVIYLHGMGSSRCDAWSILESTLVRGVSLFAFDFAGCGQSDGDYVSLGCHEESDVELVINYLLNSGRATTVALWGRSMGAATAIFRAAKDPSIAACVLDSPFSDFVDVAWEVANCTRVPVPRALVWLLLRSMRSEVLQEAGFDLMQVRPLKAAPKAKMPVWFCTGSEDDFILPHHTADLHEAWGSGSVAQTERRISYLPGTHSGMRPRWFHEAASDFLKANLQKLQAERRALAHPPHPRHAAVPLPATPRRRCDSPDASAGAPARVDAAELEQRSMRFSSAAPAVEETLRRTLRAATQAHLEGVESSRASGIRGGPCSTISGARSLHAQLLSLGISEAHAATALARCSSIEAAVEWLAKEGLM
mmetsp:Transcript_58229/g.138690  ORF Transcript_58229/g.138690 Transcript_58229/m.138690 type:complete len:438 (+) Transcript_58229:129-1442(+)|eukprot:CAMPEP_0178436042 /NCGR_PEP_ID=MMETSP0689_2-20121128/34238_1 /TAXON_ID=160604 /ORGANISM="Amphidinium massartii, Strain CS-259" /LENGTH=437 /DNA_ID=CAMNT_0020058131 /DNA_START=40 /DNA_END=1353 /DNA_ORIENTATION=+